MRPPKLLSVFPRPLSYACCFIWVLWTLAGCGSIPKYPVEGELFGERVSTTVDSEIAQYYLAHYLQGDRSKPALDERIDRLYKEQGTAQPTRETLKNITQTFSVDFATVFFAERLWANEENRAIHKTFRRFLEETKADPDHSPSHYSAYMVVFVPGWDYVEHGHITGADFAAPRKLVTDLGIENHLVEISPHGSVEENAWDLTQALIGYSQSGKNLIVTGASSAGPAIHLCLSEQLQKNHLQSVKAWVNLGGILQGSPLVDYLQTWPRSWLLKVYMWIRGWDEEELASMAVKPSRQRFSRLSLREDILIINYLGLPLSGQLSQYSQDKYPLFAPDGPNDGLTWLPDAIAPNSLTILAVGSDHFLAQDPRIDAKTVALAKTVISYLELASNGSMLNK